MLSLLPNMLVMLIVKSYHFNRSILTVSCILLSFVLNILGYMLSIVMLKMKTLETEVVFIFTL